MTVIGRVAAPELPRGSVAIPDLSLLRAELEQQRRFRVEQLENLAATTWADHTPSADDVASQMRLTLRSAATAALADIDAALDRMARNCYGPCLGCGTAIPAERLQALPMVSLCMPCQRRQDMRGPCRPSIPALDLPLRTDLCAGHGHPSDESREEPHAPAALDIVEEWGHGSFPASDPPANW